MGEGDVDAASDDVEESLAWGKDSVLIVILFVFL